VCLVASYQWRDYVDLITIRGFDRIITTRTPHHTQLDIFAPEVVVWAYEGPPQQALGAVLDLFVNGTRILDLAHFREIEGCAEVWVHREHMDRGMSIEVEPRPRAAQAPLVIIRDTPLTSGSRKVGQIQIQFSRAVDTVPSPPSPRPHRPLPSAARPAHLPR
jgi:hypothetical protein